MAEDLPVEHDAPPRPTIGRIVHYRSQTGDYTLPATITATIDSLEPAGLKRMPELALSGPWHVHLIAFSPGPATTIRELNVPLWVPGPAGAFDGEATQTLPGQVPGTWAWPRIPSIGELI